MFTDLDLDCLVTIAGLRLHLIAQYQGGRLRWALCSDHRPIVLGWAGSA